MNHIQLALLVSISLIFVSGCSSTQLTVTQYGEMRPVMREGHTQSRISIDEAVAKPHTFAVGALEGLNCEITVIDGDVWIARVAEDGLGVTGPAPDSRDKATLLTIARVETWDSLLVQNRIEGQELETFIEQAAHMRGIDTDQPFVFKIEEQLSNIELHVINGYCPIATDPSTIDAQPGRYSSTEPVHAVIVGFYARDKAGVMTHHGTSVHAHAVVSIDGQHYSWHLDRVIIKPGMILSLPES